MAATATHGMADVMTMWTATFLEVPAVTTQWSVGMSQQHQVEAALWKGYDAWVRVAKTAVNEVYKTPLFAEFATTALERTLRWQQWQHTIASAVAASVTPLTGLPTAATVDAMQEELHSLRASVAEQTAHLRALRTELQIQRTEHVPTHELPHVSTSRNGHGRPLATSPHELRAVVTS